MQRYFNSHAHVERDTPNGLSFLPSKYFNSHAHVERDNHIKGCKGKRSYFNSHAHVERDCGWLHGLGTNFLFQLTRSRGAWPVGEIVRNWINAHFNSHAHVERDQIIHHLYRNTSDFNSHAHVERDALKFYNDKTTLISTHTLTWSVTCFNNSALVSPFISTHTLTWSVTL